MHVHSHARAQCDVSVPSSTAAVNEDVVQSLILASRSRHDVIMRVSDDVRLTSCYVPVDSVSSHRLIYL